VLNAKKQRPKIADAPVEQKAILDPHIDPFVGPPEPPPSISVSVLRPRDLLLLDFKFINFKYVPGSGDQPGKLHRAINSQAAYIVVQFPQQSIMEQAFFESDPNISVIPSTADPASEEPDSATPPIYARISGFSRLVFRRPENAQPIPFTTEDLLKALLDYPLQVAPTALPPQKLSQAPGWIAIPKLANQLRAGLVIKAQKKSYKSLRRAERVHSALAYAQATRRVKNLAPAIELSRYEIERLTLNKVADFLKLKPTLAPPTDLETSIETPFRLILSPNQLAAWVHAFKEVVAVHKMNLASWPGGIILSALAVLPKLVVDGKKGLKEVILWPVKKFSSDQPSLEIAEINAVLLQAGGAVKKQAGLVEPFPWYENVDWVELWHTRLATRLHTGAVDEGPNYLRTVRAIWAKDAAFTTNITLPPQPYSSTNPSFDDPVRYALDANDRFNIVHLSANYHLNYVVGQKNNIEITGPYNPQPASVDRMMLSTLGSWLNLHGEWEQLPNGLSVEEWRHRSTMARDHYVRVVYKGFLFPFGHRASLVKVTERKFHGKLPGNPAYLRQRMFIVVREPERTYSLTDIREPGTDNQYDLAFPFNRVRITTLVTPLIDKPEKKGSNISNQGRLLFRPVEGSTKREIRFHMIADDQEGHMVEFSTPLIFVNNQVASDLQLMKAAQFNFTKGSDSIPPAAPAELNGQTVCFATSQEQGDTSFPSEKLWFGAQVPEDPEYNQLKTIYSPDSGRFYPRIEKAAVHIPAIQHLAGNNGVATFKYPNNYLAKGFETGNEGQVFAELLDDAVKLSFAGQGQRSGGLLSPEMQINGLSRLLGPVGGSTGDLGDITTGKFDPEKFFAGAGLNPKLFGVIDLWDIVTGIPSIAGDPDSVPRFITQSLGPAQSLMVDLNSLADRMEGIAIAQAAALKAALDTVIDRITALPGSIPALSWQQLKDSLVDFTAEIDLFLIQLMDPSIPASVRIPLEAPLAGLKKDLANAQKYVDDLDAAIQLITDQKVSLDWRPKLHDWVLSGATIFDTRSGQANLHLHAEVDARATLKGDPCMLVSCGLEKFNLNLIGKDTLASFIILRFAKIEFVYSGSQKADVNVDLEEIEFVGVLSFVEALKSLIPLDGFKDPPDLDVSASGISASYTRALPNLAFGVFSLCNLSLSAGFSIPFIGDPISVRFAFCTRDNPFTLTVSLFGGGGFFGIALQPDGLQLLEASFEFGASLSIDFGVASGGVYIMAGIYFKMDQKTVALTGYFRMGGKVSVLGLISASIELYLSLTYEFSSGKCVGRAQLTIEVSVLFFSVSVTITCERKFAGSSSDPTFAQLMAPYLDPVSANKVDPWVQYCEAFALGE